MSENTLKKSSIQTIDGSVVRFSSKGVPIPPNSTQRTDKIYKPQTKTNEASMNQSSYQRPARLENLRKRRMPTTAVTSMATGVRTWISHGSPRTCEPDDISWFVPTVMVGRQSAEMMMSKESS